MASQAYAELSAQPDYPPGVLASVDADDCSACDLARPPRLPADGLGGVVGARLRLRHLRRGAGLGPARADRATAERLRRSPGLMGDGPGRRLILLLVRGDRDRQVAVSEGSERGLGTRVPVRLDEPRL